MRTDSAWSGAPLHVSSADDSWASSRWLAFGIAGPFVSLVPIDGSREPIQLTTGFALGWTGDLP